MMPVSGMAQMFDMMINSFYGGVGVGLSELLHIYHHRGIYIRLDGGANPGVFGA